MRVDRLGSGLRVAAFICVTGLSVAAKPKSGKKAAPPAGVAVPSEMATASEAGPPVDAVAVTVVEVAGNQAYLTPGTKGGVRRGAMVTIEGKSYQVVQATESFAAIIVAEGAVREKAEGTATRVDEAAVTVVQLAKPRPATTWQRQWPEPIPPARNQTPRFVPLGDVTEDRRWDVRLSLSGSALLPLGARGANLARAELDARVHAQPFGAPAALDTDLALTHWFDPSASGRVGAASRPTLYVRELLASYAADGLYGAVGRMRYAASTLGMLDGARASAPLGGGLSLGAFGGVLPNPLSGAPSLAGNRFGVEATYQRPELDLRPEAALVVHGSTFDGRVDERRISGVFAMYPGASRFGGYFQVAGFDSGNPWKANTVELTEAGVDSSVHAGVFELGGRFDVRQPERSRWLASYLPGSFLCTTVPSAPARAGSAEPCDGKVSTLAYGTVDAGVMLDRVTLFVGGTSMSDLTQSGAPSTLGAFATGRVVRILRLLRLDASASYSRSTYVDLLGGSAGPGVSLFGDSLDVSTHYRATVLQYRASPASLLQHAAGGTLVWLLTRSLLFAFEGEVLVGGDDTDALMLFATVTFHPRS